MSFWLIAPLFAMFAWAGSDFFSKRGTRPDDKSSHLKLVITVGTVMPLFALFYYILYKGVAYEPIYFVKYLPVSAVYIVSMVFGYMGLRYIELSVSSPICNSSGAVVLIFCLIFLHQDAVPLQIVGAALICLGVFLLSFLEKRYIDAERRLLLARPELESERKYRLSAVAILLPLLYMFLDSLGTIMDIRWLDDARPVLSEDQANISYMFTFGLCAVPAFLYMRFVKREKFSYRKEGDFDLAAICETAGQFGYIYAVGDTAHAGINASIIASYCVFSVLLSRIFLREKLKLPQYGVIAMTVVGIAIVGYFDGG
ncbi:MAG: DMT family transporter [Firmicutes bacterium]|nr:DMT family transporter [Bacillota bacterium]